MATVWITGAHGFIGRNLARHLASQGDTVCGLGHGLWPPGDAGNWGVSTWINGDVTGSNLRTLLCKSSRPNQIVHLAGGAAVGAAVANPREDFSRTVQTTAELLEWLRHEAPETSLLAVSSAAVYGAGYHTPISESATTQPYSPYGFHKKMMELLCQSYAQSYGQRIVIARLFSVYGAGLRKQLLWDLCTKIASGAGAIELGGAGDEQRDWADVRDVARALSMTFDLASAAVPIVNVATGVATSVRSIANAVAKEWERRGKNVAFEFNGKSRAGDPQHLQADVGSLTSLGFKWQIPVSQGIYEYVSWFIADSQRPE